MAKKVFDIELNTTMQRPQMTDIAVNQGDRRSIVFRFRVYDGANEIEYRDLNRADFMALKPDGNPVQLITTRLDHGFEITLSAETVSAVGVVTAGLVLYGLDGERIVTLYFSFTVVKDILNWQNISSGSEITDLERIVAILESVIALYEQFPHGFLRVLNTNHTAQQLQALNIRVGGHIMASGYATIAGHELRPGDILERANVAAANTSWVRRGGIRGVGFNPRGAWVSRGQYFVNDIVTLDGQTFACILNNAGSTRPDADNETARSRWQLWAGRGATGPVGADGAGFRFRGEWVGSPEGGPYIVNDVVTARRQTWICRIPHTTIFAPGISDAWHLLAASGRGIHARATNLANRFDIPNCEVGDHVLNIANADRTFLGVNVSTGGLVRVTTDTTGVAAGNIRGPVGATGPVGPVDPMALNIANAANDAAGSALQNISQHVESMTAHTPANVGAEPARTLVTQAEAEEGTSTAVRSWNPQRVKQAINRALKDMPGPPDAGDIRIDGIEIATNSNLDDFRRPGNYFCIRDVFTIQGMPEIIESAFSLQIISHGNNQSFTQILTTRDAGGGPGTLFVHRRFFRTFQQSLSIPQWVEIFHTENPPTPAQVGLGNVDNTSDTDKPVSTAQRAAINAVEDRINGILIPESANLNTDPQYRVPGNYTCPTHVTARTITGIPVGMDTAFSLEVVPIGLIGQVMIQRLTAMYSNRMFWRVNGGWTGHVVTAWSDWREVAELPVGAAAVLGQHGIDQVANVTAPSNSNITPLGNGQSGVVGIPVETGEQYAVFTLRRAAGDFGQFAITTNPPANPRAFIRTRTGAWRELAQVQDVHATVTAATDAINERINVFTIKPLGESPWTEPILPRPNAENKGRYWVVAEDGEIAIRVEPGEGDFIFGDVDGNGTINSNDRLRLRRYFNPNSDPSWNLEIDYRATDLNMNGEIDGIEYDGEGNETQIEWGDDHLIARYLSANQYPEHLAHLPFRPGEHIAVKKVYTGDIIVSNGEWYEIISRDAFLGNLQTTLGDLEILSKQVADLQAEVVELKKDKAV